MNTATLGISAEEGLDISGVLYNYTAVKNVVDDFTVTIENDKVGGGYVFQEEHDWNGKHGMKIQNIISLPYTPIEQFGDGRIKSTGKGSIEDVTILYMYRWDECRNPQNNENCAGYIPPMPKIPKIEIYDALDDEYVAKAMEETNRELIDDEDKNNESNEEDEEKDRLEIALASSSNALTIASEISQSVLLQIINKATNINDYYVANIPSTTYKDTITLQDKDIVDNRLVFKSLSQDSLMNQMVEEQYK